MKQETTGHIEQFIRPENLSAEPKEMVPLRRKLGDLCKASSPKVEIMTITPEMAAVMLERNIETNRNQSKHVLSNYRDEFKGKRMMLTNQGLGFDTKGRLIDGQHRLMACIATNTAFDTIVVFGLDPNAFMVVDSGYKRTAGHKIGIAGFPESNNLAAAARIVLMNDLLEIDLRNGALGVTAKGWGRIPDEFIVDFCEETPDFVSMRKWYQTYKKFPPVSKSALHAVHWMLQQKHPKLADAFIEQLCYGESLKRSENVYRLREHLMALYVSREKLPKAWQLCWIIDAFNDTRRGKTTKFVMVSGRDFPKVLS